MPCTLTTVHRRIEQAILVCWSSVAQEPHCTPQPTITYEGTYKRTFHGSVHAHNLDTLRLIKGSSLPNLCLQTSNVEGSVALLDCLRRRIKRRERILTSVQPGGSQHSEDSLATNAQYCRACMIRGGLRRGSVFAGVEGCLAVLTDHSIADLNAELLEEKEKDFVP